MRPRPSLPGSAQAAGHQPTSLGESGITRAESLRRPDDSFGPKPDELPPLTQALLTAGEVDRLFDDIAQHATDVALVTQTSRGSHDLLQVAKRQLMDGTIQRVQLRYVWDGASWIDTLDHRSNRIKLVRMRSQPFDC